MSVSIRLADDLDISRGDMICRPHNHPHATQDIDAMIVWMQQGTRIQEGNRYIIKHTTRTAKTIVKDLQYRLDINDLHRDEKTTSLGLERDRPSDLSRSRSRSSSTSTGAIVRPVRSS